MSDRRQESHGDDDVTPPRGTPKPFSQAANTLGPKPKPKPFSQSTSTLGPTPRDRGGERIQVTTELESFDDDEYDDDWDEYDDEPNYLIRRLILLSIVLVGIVVAFVVVTQFLGGDDEGSTGDGAAEWDTLLVLTNDEIRLLDRDGLDELDVIDAGPDLLDDQAVVAGNTLVTMTDEGRITQIDLVDGTERRGRAGADQTLQLSPENPQIALVAPDGGGGDVTIVDTIRNSILSIGDTSGLDDPIIFAENVHVNDTGTHVAAPVPSAFQSVVIDLVNETSEAYAGRVIAIDDERVVTEQPAGDESEIEFHELTGGRLGTVDVPSPTAILLTPGGDLLLVGDDGSVRTATDEGDVSDRDPVVDADGARVTVDDGVAVLDGTRLLLSTSAGTVVLDADGTQLAVVDGSPATIATRANRCIVVATGGSSRPSSAIDLETGELLTEIDRGLVTASSLDGCTAAISGAASPRLLTDGGVVDVDANSVEAIAPDGSAYVVLDGRDTEYIAIGDDPIEITDEASFIRFGLRE